MELREALSQIAEIREQMARAELFRGIRAAPVAASGGLAVLIAGIQAAWLSDPTRQIGLYLGLWGSAAALSLVGAGAGIVLAGAAASPLRGRVTRMAVEQFLPCLVTGGLLTAVVVSSVPEGIGMLPGLWQVLFSLGVFASLRHLPRATVAVAAWYLASGMTCLVLGRGDQALAPWTMAVPFGVGQLLGAAILYWALERGDAEA